MLINLRRIVFFVVLLFYMMPCGVFAKTIKLIFTVDKNNENYKEILNRDNRIQIEQEGRVFYYMLSSVLREGLRFQINKDLPFDVFFVSNGSKLFLTSINPVDSMKTTVNIYIPMYYRFNDKKVICPKCGKSDSTKSNFKRIAYWFNKEDELYENEIVTYITSDSVAEPGTVLHKVLSGKYVCERDRIEF